MNLKKRLTTKYTKITKFSQSKGLSCFVPFVCFVVQTGFEG
jgi:hypothetical protein